MPTGASCLVMAISFPRRCSGTALRVIRRDLPSRNSRSLAKPDALCEVPALACWSKSLPCGAEHNQTTSSQSPLSFLKLRDVLDRSKNRGTDDALIGRNLPVKWNHSLGFHKKNIPPNGHLPVAMYPCTQVRWLLSFHQSR